MADATGRNPVGKVGKARAMKCGECGKLVEPYGIGLTWRCSGCARWVYYREGREIEIPKGCLVVVEMERPEL